MTTTPEISATSVPCVQCGYDLRATPANARCPECGMAVTAALAHQRGELFPPRRLFWHVGAGLGWTLCLLTLALVDLAVALLPTSVFGDHDQTALIIAFLVFIAGLLILFLASNSMLAHSLIPRDPNRKRKYLLLALRLAPLLFFAINILVLILFEILSSPLSHIPLLVLHISAQIPPLLALIGYVLLIAWRLRDLAHTAPALHPTPWQYSLIRLSMTLLVLLAIADIFVTYPTPNDANISLSIYLLIAIKSANLLLLGILAGLHFHRTYTFYHHCKILWTFSQAPQPEPHP